MNVFDEKQSHLRKAGDPLIDRASQTVTDRASQTVTGQGTATSQTKRITKEKRKARRRAKKTDATIARIVAQKKSYADEVALYARTVKSDKHAHFMVYSTYPKRNKYAYILEYSPRVILPHMITHYLKKVLPTPLCTIIHDYAMCKKNRFAFAPPCDGPYWNAYKKFTESVMSNPENMVYVYTKKTAALSALIFQHNDMIDRFSDVEWRIFENKKSRNRICASKKKLHRTQKVQDLVIRELLVPFVPKVFIPIIMAYLGNRTKWSTAAQGNFQFANKWETHHQYAKHPDPEG